MIARRPASIGRRQELGHWEADLLIFQRVHGKANLTSLVERKSRLLRLVNRDRRSQSVVGAIGEVLAALPPTARRTITFDRGSEFLGYDHLAKHHAIDAYFCDPHSPLPPLAERQRGEHQRPATPLPTRRATPSPGTRPLPIPRGPSSSSLLAGPQGAAQTTLTEHQAFTRALVCSHAARAVRHQGGSRRLPNSVIWIVDKEGDLPDWLLVNNPRVRHIPLAKPDHRTRRTLARQLVRSIDGATDPPR